MDHSLVFQLWMVAEIHQESNMQPCRIDAALFLFFICAYLHDLWALPYPESNPAPEQPPNHQHADCDDPASGHANGDAGPDWAE